MEISKDFRKWLDAYGNNRSSRLTLARREYLGEGQLFNGQLLSDVILIAQKLMTEYGDVTYEEHWSGYEDMSPTLTWHVVETDEEYNNRIKEMHGYFLAEKEGERKRKEREKIEEELQALQKKLNSLK